MISAEIPQAPIAERISDGLWGLKATLTSIVFRTPVRVEKTVIEDVPILDGHKRPDLAGLPDEDVVRAGHIGRTVWTPPTVAGRARVVEHKLVW